MIRRSHPPSPEAPPLGGEEGEARVLLRSRADKATAKQNTARLCEAEAASLRRSRASERFRPTGVQEGATGLPVGLHAPSLWNLLAAACCLAVFSLAPSVTASDVGNVKALIKAKQALREDPEDIDAHRAYQSAMLEDGWREKLIAEYAERLDTQGRTPVNLYLLARLKEGEEAANAFTELIEAFPDSPWGYLGLSATPLAQGEHDEAGRLCEQALALKPDLVPAYLQLARVKDVQGRPEEADAVALRGLERVPGDPELLAYHGTFLWELKRYDDALAALRQVLSRDPEHELALRHLGSVLTSLRRHEEAISARAHYLELWPSRAETWATLCQNRLSLYDREGDVEQLARGEADCRQSVEVDPADPDSYYRLIDFYTERKWWVHALWYNQKGLELTPPDHDNYDALAHNLEWIPANRMSSSSFTIEAVWPADLIRAREDVSEAERDALGGERTAGAWEALTAVMGGSSGLSQENLDALIKQFPDFAPAYYNRGSHAFRDRKRQNEARADFEQAVVLAPEWGRPHGALAVMAMKEKRYQDARRTITTAATRDPTHPAIQYNQRLMEMFDEAVVGGTIAQLRQIRQAVEAGADVNLDTFEVLVAAFEGYLKRDPTSPAVHEAFGDIFAASPNPAYHRSALPHYRKAIELGGNKEPLSSKIAAIEQPQTGKP